MTPEAIGAWVSAVMAPHWAASQRAYSKARRKHAFGKKKLRHFEMPDPAVIDDEDPELG